MLSCYAKDPDEATVKLLAEELLRKYTNETNSQTETETETDTSSDKAKAAEAKKATVKVFTDFLKRNAFNKDVAYTQWKEYNRWRESVGADSITESDYPNQVLSKEAVWQGKDKQDRPCLIVTARLHKCSRTVGSGQSFQKFIIHTVEKGLDQADEEGKEEVCILYDRRGMEWEHIDTALTRFCQDVVSMLQHWYAHRMGSMYILHLGTFYWVLYTFLLWPFVSLLGDKVVIITNPPDLLKYFNVEDLPDNFIESGIGAAEERDTDTDTDKNNDVPETSSAPLSSSSSSSVPDPEPLQAVESSTMETRLN